MARPEERPVRPLLQPLRSNSVMAIIALVVFGNLLLAGLFSLIALAAD